MILPYATHRIEHIYPEPEKFIPERFTQENCEGRNPYAFLPFSAGPRNCVCRIEFFMSHSVDLSLCIYQQIGYKFAMIEMKTVISTLLRKYRFLPVPDKTQVRPLFRVTLRATGGLWVKFDERRGAENKS